MILVVGASGMLGGRVARQLLAAGRPVRALSRDPGKVEELRALGAEVVRGDLRDPASLRRACEGAERLVTTANGFIGRGREAPGQVDLRGNRNLVDAARAASVQQFVLVSASVAAAESTVDFFRYKAAAEAYLRSSGVPFTLLRPGAFMEVWGEMIGGKAAAKGVTTILGRGTNPINFVAVDDVARVCVRVLEDPGAIGQTITFGGRENLTPLEVAALYEAALGRPLRRTHVPRAALRVLGTILRPFHPAAARMMEAGLQSDSVPHAIEPPGIPAWLGVDPVGFRDWIVQRAGPDPGTDPRSAAPR